jgi:hypothetical protein
VGAQSIARRHTTYVIMPKKPTLREFFFGKIKKEQFERRIFKKKSAFSPLKWLNKRFSKMTFFFDPNFAGSFLWRVRNFADIKTEFWKLS